MYLSSAIFTCFLASTQAAAEEANPPVIQDYKGAKEFFKKVEQWQGLKKLPAAPEELSFRFIPKAISGQRTRSVPVKGSDQEHYLYIREVGYDPGDKSLGIGLVIYDVNQGGRILAVNAYIPASPEQAEAVQRSWEDYSLIAELAATLSSVPEPKTPSDTRLEFYGKWRAPRLRLLSSEREILSAQAAVRDGAFLSPHHKPAKMRQKLSMKSVFEIEAEDMNGLIYFSDWERHEKGWYGRELRYAAGTGIAVIHEKNMGAIAVHRFDRPLPAGIYRVQLDPHKGSARWADTIVEVELADARRAVTWFNSSREKDSFSCAPLTTSKPAPVLRIRAIQCGSGGINSVPEMKEPTIMLDTLRIMRLEWSDDDGEQQLEKDLEDASE
ncbi:MAG: hypothetical protein QGF00_23010 [Planctomycetota bacterium]|nr:hypothetical protein [Planctomycetota bacterium]MDP7252499.1 hypothetical protein [Planctomycetota bacterium]